VAPVVRLFFFYASLIFSFFISSFYFISVKMFVQLLLTEHVVLLQNSHTTKTWTSNYIFK